MQRLRTVSLWVILSGIPTLAAAVDLNGKWRFGSAIVEVTQTGSSLSISWVVTLTGSVGATDANGFTSYQVDWTDGVNIVAFGGRIMPSENLLDGRGGTYFPPDVPQAGGVVATRCTCDDGNTNGGDGCDVACQVEECWTCIGDPSVCTPTLDGGACDDHSPCTTGETCTSGVCGGGTPVASCFDISGPWSRHHFVPGLGIESHSATTVSQRGTDLLIDSYVGTIDPLTGAFDIRSPNLNFFCGSFNTLIGSVAADGLTYSAAGFTQEPNEFAPDHCDQFAVAETGDHCGDGNLDAGEQCDDGNFLAGDGCNILCQLEPCFVCSGASCVLGPRTACKASSAPAKSIVHIKDSADDSKDRFSWRWNKGADTALSELGNPSGVTLCVYDESAPTAALLFRATIPASAPWATTASGFLFKDAAAGAEGISLTQLKSGVAGKAKAKVKGNGIHLSDRPYPLPAPALPLPLRVQLQGENGLCLETRHDASGVLRNDPGVFKAKGTP